MKLLNWGFNKFSRVVLAKQDELIPNKIIVDWGVTPIVETRIAKSIITILDAQDQNALKREISMPERIEAPIQRGDQLGELHISIKDSTIAKLPIVAGTSIERMGILEKFLSFF